MASKNMEQGIAAIQQQNDMVQGKRLLKIALKKDPLTQQERVTTLLWLAETDSQPQFKVEQYQEAIRLDPGNQDVMNRLQYWTQQMQSSNTPSQGMPPVDPNQGMNFGQQQSPQQGQFGNQQQQYNQGFTPSQGMTPMNTGFTPSQGVQPTNNQSFQPQQPGYQQQPRIHISQVQRSVGILIGGTLRGTGFFVSRDGLVATTRQLIGGEREIGIALLDGRQIPGTVVRSFPHLDLAIIQTNVMLDHLLPVSEASIIPDDMPITAVTHSGEGLRSTKRRTINQLAPHWFPTLINVLKDGGGNPIFDVNNVLIGMLTANKQRSNGYYYGLHIEKIYQCVSIYVHETGQLQAQNTIYCNACGVISRAPQFGGFFCENCGNTHPYALEISRYPQPNLAGLYGESSPNACPNCGSQAGFYNRDCQRCGYSL